MYNFHKLKLNTLTKAHTYTFHSWYTNKLIIENCQMLNNKMENTTLPITISGYMCHRITTSKRSQYIFFSGTRMCVYASYIFDCYVVTCTKWTHVFGSLSTSRCHFAPYVDTHFCMFIVSVRAIAWIICVCAFQSDDGDSCYKHLPKNVVTVVVEKKKNQHKNTLRHLNAINAFSSTQFPSCSYTITKFKRVFFLMLPPI